VSIQTTALRGAAPLHVVLTASGDAASYHWDLGDGTTADGPSIDHLFPAGRFVVRVTATAADGETAQAEATILALALTVHAGRVANFGGHLVFRGRLVPALRGARVRLVLGDRRVASGVTRRDGRFRIGAPIRAPGSYAVEYGGAVSRPVSVVVRPRIAVGFRGSGEARRPLLVVARVRPTAAGTLRLRVWRDGKQLASIAGGSRVTLRLPTARASLLRIALVAVPAPGFVAARRSVAKVVYLSELGLGSRGPSVRALEARLAALHYALAGVDASFGPDTYDAVVAFQKVHGLPRTGRVDRRFWLLLAASGGPRARYGGDHVEVDKSRQVLFIVRRGQVALIVPVSTGATGNTPVGVWRVYSKVPGTLPTGMFDSSFFLRGFAIHGYPSVPTYPASHGCVRVPMWVAPRLYDLIPYGATVRIY
jgi:lipoprotein-anchoring transpeptidase ErfK/SrfK